MSRTAPSGPAEAPIALRLMREFELRRGEQVVRMPPVAQRLVGLVAIEQRRVIRLQVSALLWPDLAEERAAASLRSALWRLTAAGAPDVVGASKSHLWLQAWVDVDYRAALARTRMVGVGAAVIDVQRELQSFADDLLPGWYDDWVVAERDRFRHQRLQTLDEVGDQLLSDGRLADALQVGLAGVDAEPLRETAHRLVVRVHLRQGNVADAVRQYRSYAALLADELGAVPSPAMNALVQSCLRGPRELARSAADAHDRPL